MQLLIILSFLGLLSFETRNLLNNYKRSAALLFIENSISVESLPV